MSGALTPAQKRAITRAANKAKREAKTAEAYAALTARAAADNATLFAERAAEPPPPKRRTREDEAFLVRMVEAAQQLLAQCRAELAAQEAKGRQDLAQQPIVNLAEWRRTA